MSHMNLATNLKKVCATVVTYNPDERFPENIRAILPQVEQVIIVDNGSNEESLKFIQQVGSAKGVHVIYNLENLGIGAALNIGVKNAIKAGHEWVLTLDQDSHAEPEMVKQLLSAYQSHQNLVKVGIVAPKRIEERAEPPKRLGQSLSHRYTPVPVTMASGSLLHLATFKEHGFFEEELFIDYVDHEYCLRLASAGFQIIETDDAKLRHNCGHISRHRLLALQFYTTNHDPLRRYYSARNRFLLYKRYLTTSPLWVVRDIFEFTKEVVKIVLVEKKKRQKLNCIGRGIVHSFTGQLGPYPQVQA